MLLFTQKSNSTQDEKPTDSLSSLSLKYHCAGNEAATIITIIYSVTRISLLLPLSTFVLYLGYRRWWQRRSFAMTSHSDIFTYNMIAVELIYMFGAIFYFWGSDVGSLALTEVGAYVSAIVYPGQIVFQILTCVERYLAAARPVTYFWLKQSGGVRIRNVSIGCGWLFSFSWIGITAAYNPGLPYIPYFCFVASSLVIISFCSFCVLRVLIRPGPGDVGGDRVLVDQSKKRAFYTVTAIMGALWLWFIGLLVGLTLDNSEVLNDNDGCAVLIAANWLTLPVSLMLPLLFLHRAGKLSCSHCTSRC